MANMISRVRDDEASARTRDFDPVTIRDLFTYVRAYGETPVIVDLDVNSRLEVADYTEIQDLGALAAAVAGVQQELLGRIQALSPTHIQLKQKRPNAIVDKIETKLKKNGTGVKKNGALHKRKQINIKRALKRI